MKNIWKCVKVICRDVGDNFNLLLIATTKVYSMH